MMMPDQNPPSSVPATAETAPTQGVLSSEKGPGLRHTVVSVFPDRIPERIAKLNEHPLAKEGKFRFKTNDHGNDGRVAISVESDVDLSPVMLNNLRERARSV